MNVGDLAALLEVEVVTLSHHLGILRNANLLEKERKGRFISYRLSPDVFQRGAAAKTSEHFDLGCCRLEVPRAK
jgi:DNA-binding transcriptional ArsR family regulator